jgi:signal transduction histidine kinase
MRSLFLKIFLSFWLATALFVVLGILVTLALRPPREASNWEALQAAVPAEAVQAFEQGGEDGLHRYQRSLRETRHVRAYVFDDKGKDVTGRNPPDWIVRVLEGKTRTADTFWGRLGPLQFLRGSTTDSQGRRYSVVIELPPDAPMLFGPHDVPGLGIFIAILSSGLVCYVLARFLTSPVTRLRAATQKLAAGDLTARAGRPGERGGDEIAELVRDFDGMAERLENLVNAQSRLLSDISHELRSPLARLNVALALASQRSGPEAQSALERIDLEANRLNELIGRLLTIARLEGGDGTMHKIPVSLEELVGEISQDADFEAQSRGCRVVAVIVRNSVVTGIPSLLHSAIENVVRNASRYTGEGTEVEVCLDQIQGPTGPEAVVRVSDFGPGVPVDSLDKLFRPFYRIDDARRRQTGGVGLGLAITERAVRLHHGTVKATNRPGGGLIVEIRLPAAPATVAGTTAPAAMEV